jgi:hypothetical protein
MPFSIFGVGPYSFQPYKVAVSGLHAAPRFQAIEPVEGRPVVFDDTCYFLPVDSSDSARRVVAALESESIRRLLAAVVAPGSKRKVTKRLLDRIDHERLLAAAT